MINKILDYEQGTMNDDDVIQFFQELIDTGLVWQLQGHYGRMANNLIRAGFCKRTIIDLDK